MIDPATRNVELFRGAGSRAVAVEADAGAMFVLGSIYGVSLGPVETADGPRLRVDWPGGSAQV